MEVAFTDLLREIVAVVAACLEPADFCALRQTCREHAALEFDDYAVVRITRARGRPYSVAKKMLAPLLKHTICAIPGVDGGCREDCRVLAAAVADNEHAGMLADVAAGCGKIWVLEWLAPKGAYSVNRAAAKGGHLAVFRWLRAHNWPASHTVAACRAAYFGHTEMFAAIIAARPRIANKRQVIDAACQGGCPAVLDCLAAATSQSLSMSLGPSTLTILGAKNKVDALDWFLSHGYVSVLKNQVCSIAHGAIINNRHNVLVWLNATGFFNIDAVCLPLRESAARIGAFRILDWVTGEVRVSASERVRLADLATMNGRLSVLDWLVAHGLDEHEFATEALRTAAVLGRTCVLHWTMRTFGYSARAFAKYAGRHEALDAFLAEHAVAAAAIVLRAPETP